MYGEIGLVVAVDEKGNGRLPANVGTIRVTKNDDHILSY